MTIVTISTICVSDCSLEVNFYSYTNAERVDSPPVPLEPESSGHPPDLMTHMLKDWPPRQSFGLFPPSRTGPMASDPQDDRGHTCVPRAGGAIRTLAVACTHGRSS